MMTLALLAAPAHPYSGLVRLLIDSVQNGASVGFVPPLGELEAQAYWRDVAADLRSGTRLLLVASVGGEVAGAVQLALCEKKNGQHRAEVEKLMVHTTYRRQSIGDALMTGIECVARERSRTLLVLDTRCDDHASRLYRKRGFVEAGRIPGYALSASGRLEGTSYFYKQMSYAGSGEPA